MRRFIVNIFLLMLIAMPCRAVSYQPMQPMQFQSTSGYVQTRNAGGCVQSSGSLSSISASNFNTLNSEGGACHLSSGPRRGRPTSNDNGGTGAIGNYDLHSPIGDTPWWLMIVCACAYAYYIRRKQCSKQQNK